MAQTHEGTLSLHDCLVPVQLRGNADEAYVSSLVETAEPRLAVQDSWQARSGLLPNDLTCYCCLAANTHQVSTGSDAHAACQVERKSRQGP